MIPDDVVERVREQADIVAIVGELVKLKRSGSSFRGPCPFHQGKDPNFSVSPRGGYMCFVCHEKGDVFTFVQKRLGLDFVEAVKYVGAKSGVEVTEVSRERQGPDPREKFWEVNGAAAEYFTQTLWNDAAGAAAREYLAGRQIDRATADRFGMGFAARDGGLQAYLGTLGFDEARLIEAGLLHVREEGSEPRLRFRNRLMFPIYDPQSRVVAFGGRVIGAGEPKYLNSAESPVFVKGATLYGLNWAKNAIRRDERALLVEGYFDCVRLIAAGIESAVAPLGTALTEPQAELIHKYTNTVFLLYDSDKAGLKATFRAGDVLLRQGFKVHVVTLPDGEDPDTFVAKHGPEQLEAQLGHAIDVFERKIQILQRGGWFTDLRRKRIALDRLLPTIRAASDPITRGLYVAKAAEAVGVGEEVLERELKGGTRRSPIADRGPTFAKPARVQPSGVGGFNGAAAERELVRLLVHRRPLVERAAEEIGVESFREPRLAQIFMRLLESQHEPIDALAIALDEESVGLLNDLAADPGGLDLPERLLRDCVSSLKRRELGEKIDEIDRQMPLAKESQKSDLVRQKRELATQITALGGQRWPSFAARRSADDVEEAT